MSISIYSNAFLWNIRNWSVCCLRCDKSATLILLVGQKTVQAVWMIMWIKLQSIDCHINYGSLNIVLYFETSFPRHSNISNCALTKNNVYWLFVLPKLTNQSSEDFQSPLTLAIHPPYCKSHAALDPLPWMPHVVRLTFLPSTEALLVAYEAATPTFQQT